MALRGRVSKVASGKLFVLIITNFVDMVGLLMIIPLMPFYALEMGGGGFEVAILMSAFTAAQLLSAPLWGRFSDRYGRRPALLVGLTAACFAYIVFAYATSIWLLLLSRIVQGAGGGTVGVIQAYVADSVEPDNRARALGWLSAATNVGVAIGPALGGVALRFGRSGPGLAAASLCLVNIFFAWKFLRESRDMTEAHDKKPRASRTVIARVITHPGEAAPRLIWIYAIAMGAFSGLMAILAVFLHDRFAVGKDQIWIFYTYVGVISVVARLGILGKMVDRYGEAQLSRRSIRRGAAVANRTRAARDGPRNAPPRARLLPPGDRGGADSTGHCVHISMCDVNVVPRDLEQGAWAVHGSAADVRRVVARDNSAVGGLFL